jgi:hypothetical protein
MDSRAVDTSRFDQVVAHLGDVQDDVRPTAPERCFAGAWYRKVMSSRDRWLGIEGVIRLGEFTPDDARHNLDGKGRYMDNPSVYMGGNAKSESDAGLGLNLSYLSGDTSEPLDLSAPKRAYRPFWRYIYDEAVDVDGNVHRRSINSWNITEPEALMYYYFPGDLLRMKIYSPLPHYLQLRIEVIEPTTNPTYVALRRSYGLPDDRPSDFYSPIVRSEGHGVDLAAYKRVNSIDQYGNEGFQAHATKARVSTATWEECWLYRLIDGELRKLPFTPDRQRANACPDGDAFTITVHEPMRGGERIAIHPATHKER